MEHAISFPALGLDFNINRVAVNLFGKDIYWYGIIICLGFVLAALYINRRTKEFGVTSDNLMDCLIIGVPVGFVNVIESKELVIANCRAPYIVARGRKGGSNVAAAICNAMLYQIRR